MTDSHDPNRPLPPLGVKALKALRRPLEAVIAVAVIAVISGCGGAHGGMLPSTTADAGNGRGLANIAKALPGTSPTPIPAAGQSCGGPAGMANCGVKINPGHPAGSTPVGGLSATQLRSIYGLAPAPATMPATTWPSPNFTPTPGGTPPPQKLQATVGGPLVVVVDAFNDTTAEKDMGVYRAQYGLPACTAANHCFQAENIAPVPGVPPPAPSGGLNSADGTTWADETALDLAMVSAACPTCRIVLVQAAGQDLDSLINAMNAGAAYAPAAISNSWGVTEAGGNAAALTPAELTAFNKPGIAITASVGDLGSGTVQFPASSPYVTAVGGTTLTADASSARGYDETVWSGSGSGCSLLPAVPTWQSGRSCSTRAVPDVSFVGDSLNPGLSVYSSAQGGWVVLGGTSAGAPFVAGLYATAGDYGAATTGAPALYAAAPSLNPVSGANGTTLGSPNGLVGF